MHHAGVHRRGLVPAERRERTDGPRSFGPWRFGARRRSTAASPAATAGAPRCGRRTHPRVWPSASELHQSQDRLASCPAPRRRRPSPRRPRGPEAFSIHSSDFSWGCVTGCVRGRGLCRRQSCLHTKDWNFNGRCRPLEIEDAPREGLCQPSRKAHRAGTKPPSTLISQAQGFGPRPVCIAFDRDPSTGCSLAWRTANIRATLEEGLRDNTGHSITLCGPDKPPAIGHAVAPYRPIPPQR